jgi:DNA polymerase-3 subunit epsilon
MARQIVLDTETTGLEWQQDHRIIEIGCVELVERRYTGNNFHQYLQPDRLIDAEAIEVHGITNEYLKDKPRFEDIVDDLMDYLQGAELIIHNAPFDVGFLDYELKRCESAYTTLDQYCRITDSLVMARQKHPGQRNSLDALCGRYHIDNSKREKHGALLDAEILADVYLAMTGGQKSLILEAETLGDYPGQGVERRSLAEFTDLPVIRASEAELAQHAKFLDLMGEGCLYRK